MHEAYTETFIVCSCFVKIRQKDRNKHKHLTMQRNIAVLVSLPMEPFLCPDGADDAPPAVCAVVTLGGILSVCLSVTFSMLLVGHGHRCLPTDSP